MPKSFTHCRSKTDAHRCFFPPHVLCVWLCVRRCCVCGISPPPSTTAERKDDKSNYGGDKQWQSLAKKNTAAIISRSVISMLTAAKTTPVCPVRLGTCWSMPVNGKYCKWILSEHLLSYMWGPHIFRHCPQIFKRISFRKFLKSAFPPSDRIPINKTR